MSEWVKFLKKNKGSGLSMKELSKLYKSVPLQSGGGTTYNVVFMTFNQGESKNDKKLLDNFALLVYTWRNPDIIVITLQEAKDDGIFDYLSEKYKLLYKEKFSQLKLGNIQLGVFCNNENVQVDKRKSGYIRCEPAKGAVFAKIKIKKFHEYKFFGMHLPSAPGEPEKRDECMATILNKYSRPNENIFVAGDLNYRTSTEKYPSGSESSTIGSLECTSVSSDTCASGSMGIRGCPSNDQLAASRNGPLKYLGLAESEITFCQTCKLKQNRTKHSYDTTRIPSWCDRILTRTDNTVAKGEYRSVDLTNMSDHSAVYQYFKITIP
jgi:endonuclease/exonuclease/phosphatase family metal-dependent hydrolase